MKTSAKLFLLVVTLLIWVVPGETSRKRSSWQWTDWQKCKDPLACDRERYRYSLKHGGVPCHKAPHRAYYQSQSGCTCTEWENDFSSKCDQEVCDRLDQQRCKDNHSCVNINHYSCDIQGSMQCKGTWTKWQKLRGCNESCSTKNEVFQRSCLLNNRPSVSCAGNLQRNYTQTMKKLCAGHQNNTTINNHSCASPGGTNSTTPANQTLTGQTVITVLTIILVLVVIAGYVIMKRRRNTKQSVYTSNVHENDYEVDKHQPPQEIKSAHNYTLPRPFYENDAANTRHSVTSEHVYEQLHGNNQQVHPDIHKVSRAVFHTQRTAQQSSSSANNYDQLFMSKAEQKMKVSEHSSVPHTKEVEFNSNVNIPTDKSGYVELIF